MTTPAPERSGPRLWAISDLHLASAINRDALAALKLGVQSLVWGGYASPHDQVIANKLAGILTGGDLSAPAWVDPWFILDLEREAFLSLLGEQKTRDRMTHMLQTGKPLRN